MRVLDEEGLNRLLAQFGVKGHRWGLKGDKAVLEVEAALKFKLSGELAEFGKRLGNVNIGQFSIVVTGGGAGDYNAASQTSLLAPAVPDSAVKILDHAGESYMYDVTNGTVKAYDSMDFTAPTIEFGDFDEFVGWLFEEANRFENTLSMEFPS